MINVDPKLVIIMTAPYSAVDLRRVIKSVAKQKPLPQDSLQELVNLVGESKAFGSLRNHIAHAYWAPGTRPNAIRPIGLDIRSENARLYGHDDSEPDYTAQEIEAKADALERLAARIIQFAEESGLADNIRQNIKTARFSASLRVGNSTKDSAN
jgi:hypothetical protein